MFCRHIGSFWNFESQDFVVKKKCFYQSQEEKSQFLPSRDFFSASRNIKQDGSGAISSSQRVEEYNVLLLEIEATAAQV